MGKERRLCVPDPEITFRSPTFGPPIMLNEFSITTPVPLGAAVSPVGSVPMKQPATCTLPAGRDQDAGLDEILDVEPEDLRPLLADRQPVDRRWPAPLIAIVSFALSPCASVFLLAPGWL